MAEKRLYPADRAAPAEAEQAAPAGQKMAPATFSSKGISFTITADRTDGVRINFIREKTEFGPSFNESLPLLDADNMRDADNRLIISSVFARPAQNGAYSAGVVYTDKSELTVTIHTAANGNGVVFDHWNGRKQAYFFGDAATQLSDFISGIDYTGKPNTEYAGKLKFELNNNGILSIIRADDGRTMTLNAEPAIYTEYIPNGFVYITNSPPGGRMDQSITITPDGRMIRSSPTSE